MQEKFDRRKLDVLISIFSEWPDNQKKSNSSIRKLLHERIENANPRCELTNEETNRLRKLEVIADKLKRGENVQSSGGATHYLHTNYCEVVNIRY